MGKIKKIYIGTELLRTVCKICGTSFEQKYNGRTREYCNDNCKNYNKYLNALTKVIDNIDFQDYTYVKSVKSDLFIINNHMPKKVKI